MTTDIRIRAFRAIDDPDTCLKFINGHRRVLSIYGIENITTNTDEWMYNPSIFVVAVESLDGEKLFGGCRLQAADGVHPLPMEEAVGKLDGRIYDLVQWNAQYGTGELSGLWNSKEVAGLGVGSLFPSRVIVAIASQIGIKTMLSLCSPTTVRFNQWLGSRVLTDIGDNGTFYYPKIDLIATAVILDDVQNLSNTHPREREKMIFLRNNPKCVIEEKSPFKNVHIKVHYDLEIKSAKRGEFIIPIEKKLLSK
ncbi:MAG: hypothetical protein JWQ40_4167 [Segetibacter sp.]|jgi:hypothetical protein|nr:hypothetical protein [Segetibacter sp.]